jgi:hypothetical protein
MRSKQKINKLFYMMHGKNNTLLACSDSAGYFEQFGISNVSVLKWCMGLRERRLVTYDGVVVKFKVKEL